MNDIAYFKLKKEMASRGLTLQWERINCIRHHSKRGGETWKHYWCKCVTGKLLNDKNHVYFSEYEFPNGAQADIYDATFNIVIEFESTKSVKKEGIKFGQYQPYARDIFIFNTDDISDDLKEAQAQISKSIGL